MSSHNMRRRSFSISAMETQYIPRSDATVPISGSNSPSLWNSNRAFLLSRFKSSAPSTPTTSTMPTTPTIPTTPTVIGPSKSTSTAISLPAVSTQQKVKRKPLSPTNTQSTLMSSINSKIYETGLSAKSEDTTADGHLYKSKKKSNGSGFGNLFKKKRSKSIDKQSNDESIGSTFFSNRESLEKKHEAPPPSPSVSAYRQKATLEPLSRSNINVETVTDIVQPAISTVILPNNSIYKPQYQQYEMKEKPLITTLKKRENSTKKNKASTLTRLSTASISTARVSTSSYSIYSTFGPETNYDNPNNSTDSTNFSNTYTPNTSTTGITISEEALTTVADTKDEEKKELDEMDLARIVANNMQTRNPARVVSHHEDERTTEEEDNDEDESDETTDDVDDTNSDDVFVDATDVYPEDLERERIEARLSKRLSGGHFGSAGGLMMSIMAAEKQQRRTSKPPPEDISQSMMKWKRQSEQTAHTKFSTTINALDEICNDKQPMSNRENNPPVVPKKEELTSNNMPLLQYMPSASTAIVSSSLQKALPPRPETLLEVEEEDEDTKEKLEIEELPITPQSDIDDDKHEQPNLQSASPNLLDPKELASRLWNEDETFVKLEEIAEFLGQSKQLNSLTLYEYMDYFDFSTIRLDSAFRKVCAKLYFRAEAQQIDRILEAFAKRYWHCNPKSILGSSDVVYAVVYSLLLLNTDLHVAEGSYVRMTKQDFVKNTMSTIKDQLEIKNKSDEFKAVWETHIELYLKDMYSSVKKNQILQPLQHQLDGNNSLLDPFNNNESNNSFPSTKRVSMMLAGGGKRINDIKRSLNTMIHKTSSTRESMLFPEDPTPRKSTSSTTINNRNLIPPVRPPRYRKDSVSSNRSIGSSSYSFTTGPLLSPKMYTTNFMETHTSGIFTSQPPYVKEGIVMRKHLLESANQKAKHREWKECLLVVERGELRMYGSQSDTNTQTNDLAKRSGLKTGSASFANLADSLKGDQGSSSIYSNHAASLSCSGISENENQNVRWAPYSQLLGTVALNHSLSNVLPPPGYNRRRPHVFAIQEPNGGVYLIQTASQEQVLEWIETCNYWAALQSKEPLQGAVGNIEYGWGNCLDDVILDLDAVESNKKVTGKYFHNPDQVNISQWVPSTPTMVSNLLEEDRHLQNLQKYLDSLNDEINYHREIKKKILVKFPPKTQNHSKVISNWESKAKYMLHEIIKYQNYCISLQKSIDNKQEMSKEGNKAVSEP